jgi:hypothetical protein
VLLALVLSSARAGAADAFTWNTNQNRVTASIRSTPVLRVLEAVSQFTGWRVYLEENTTYNVSTTFKDLPPGDALRMLLGNLSFAIVPQSNAPSRLYVFRTSMGNATQLVKPGDLNSKTNSAKIISNELIVRLKPSANIDELARLLGAKVVGKIDGQNIYRLQFADEAATDAARQQLATNSDVLEVDSNYSIDSPPSAQKLSSVGTPPVSLKLNPPANDSGRLLVGLVDTAVQPVGSDIDSFLAKTISVAGTANPDPNFPTHGTSMFENMLRAASSVETGGTASFQVIAVDVYGPNSTTSTFDVAKGITAAINAGATIINLSLGSPGESPLLHQLIQDAAAKGIQIYAAAGNNASADPFYPAAYPEVTSVTAGTSPGHLAPYANYGSYVSLMAPGSSITYIGSSAYLVSGTSSATAFITGLTAGVADSQHVSVSTATKTVSAMPAYQVPTLH